ncbi:MAG TPA: hypothetical protein VK891_01130, partial [Euzebyales bacterium]|nr:hypothetical protein [Euzebyales bacterium]
RVDRYHAMPFRTHTLRWVGMATKPTLAFAAGMFVLTTVLFAAAMVVAHALAIPDPASRFLPSAARDLPGASASEQPDDVTFANDVQAEGGDPSDEPVATVTATPRPPAAVSSGAGPSSATTAPINSATTSISGLPSAQPTPPWWAFDPQPSRNPRPSPSPSPTPQPPESTETPTPEPSPEPSPSETPPAAPPASEPDPPTESEPPAAEGEVSRPAPSESAPPQASETASVSPGAR